MAVPQGNKKAIEKYHKEKTVMVGVNLINSKDADIIERLNSVPAKATYVKKLIREDIKNDPNPYWAKTEE